MVVYLSGKITGKDVFRVIADFEKGVSAVKEKGIQHVALNPAVLPSGMPNERYMPICMTMLDQADAILMVGDDWKESKGAAIELTYAKYQGKHVFLSIEEFEKWMC